MTVEEMFDFHYHVDRLTLTSAYSPEAGQVKGFSFFYDFQNTKIFAFPAIDSLTRKKFFFLLCTGVPAI